MSFTFPYSTQPSRTRLFSRISSRDNRSRRVIPEPGLVSSRNCLSYTAAENLASPPPSIPMMRPPTSGYRRIMSRYLVRVISASIVAGRPSFDFENRADNAKNPSWPSSIRWFMNSSSAVRGFLALSSR